MEFVNWFEKIKSNREHFIDYYVQQFGEEYRSLIAERFDSLKFCFYINPNDMDYWIQLQLNDDYIVATFQFLKDHASELGIDISKVSLLFDEDFGHLIINTDEKNISNKIKNLFGIGAIGSIYLPDDYQFSDLYSFRRLEDFVKGEGKEYSNPETELLHRRLLFLRDM